MEEQTKEVTEDVPANTMIDDANLAAKRLEDANKVKADLLAREERLMAERKLGGNTEAGETVDKKEETAKEYAARILQNK